MTRNRPELFGLHRVLQRSIGLWHNRERVTSGSVRTYGLIISGSRVRNPDGGPHHPRGARRAHHWVPRFLRSPEIYGHEEREAEQSVNFVTCHAGFTLNDLISYDRKHNEANGEENRDGADDNCSRNCGAEGPSDDPSAETGTRRG